MEARMSTLSYITPTATSPWQTYLTQVDRLLPYGLNGVKVTLDGPTVPSVVSSLDSPTVTLAVG